MNDGKILIRVPQIFTFDSDFINRTFGKQASLINDILITLLEKSTTSFLDDPVIDLDLFCEKKGYNKNELQRTLPQFVSCSKKDLPMEQGHCFDGAFENALYSGLTKVLVFNSRRFNEAKYELENMTLFSRIQVEYKKTGRREKRTYIVELDYRIRQWQLSKFYHIDKLLYESIKIDGSKIGTGELRSFYIYFSRIVAQISYKSEKQKEASFLLTVNQIANIMGFSLNRNNNRKAKVIYSLDKILMFLGKNHFNYELFKAKGARYEYTIKFTILQEILNHYVDKRTNVEFFFKLYDNSEMEYYTTVLKGKPYDLFKWRKISSKKDQEKMSRWLFSNSVEAKKYFVETFKNKFNVDYDNRFGEF